MRHSATALHHGRSRGAPLDVLLGSRFARLFGRLSRVRPGRCLGRLFGAPPGRWFGRLFFRLFFRLFGALPGRSLGRLVGLTLLLLASTAAPARDATPLAADPVLESKVMQLAEELRCLVCQNETLAASQADLAVDLRQQIRERLQRGESPERITAFLVARYGEFVRYRPTFSATTALLWAGPFALLLLGGGWLVALLRAHRGRALPQALNADDRQRLAALRRASEAAP